MINVDKVLERLCWWRKEKKKEPVKGKISPTPWVNGKRPVEEQNLQQLKLNLGHAWDQIDTLRQDKVHMTRRLTVIKDLFVDMEKVFYSSKFTRSQIGRMSPEEFLKYEDEIDKDIEEGRAFLYE